MDRPAGHDEDHVARVHGLADRVLASPRDRRLQRALARTLAQVDSDVDAVAMEYRPSLAKALESLYDSGTYIEHRVAWFAAQQIKAGLNLSAHGCAHFDPKMLRLLASNRLLVRYLERSLNVDWDLESFLGRLRRWLLLSAGDPDIDRVDFLTLASAIAQQNFDNDYVHEESDEERSVVSDLSRRLGHLPDHLESHLLDLICLAMYRPLARQPFAAALVRVPTSEFPAPVGAAMDRVLRRPSREQDLMHEIPCLGSIRREVSRAVQEQYEESPYPRWTSLAGSLPSLDRRLMEVCPHGPLTPRPVRGPVKILVPGSGTGQHPIMIALADPEADVLAVDLSRASLAYGVRVAKEIGVTNIRFLHADLLDLSELGEQFQHVDCIGVLHHLACPIEGWSALVSTLVPGGTMNIGVYSEVARLPVTFLRSEIERLGLKPRPEEMRRFRKLFFTEERYRQLRRVFNSADLYSLSTVRDLLFHVQEHRFTVSQLSSAIDELGLEFLGFTLPDRNLRERYRQRFPTNSSCNSMQNWRAFEREFAGTRQQLTFWCRRPPA